MGSRWWTGYCSKRNQESVRLGLLGIWLRHAFVHPCTDKQYGED